MKATSTFLYFLATAACIVPTAAAPIDKKAFGLTHMIDMNFWVSYSPKDIEIPSSSNWHHPSLETAAPPFYCIFGSFIPGCHRKRD